MRIVLIVLIVSMLATGSAVHAKKEQPNTTQFVAKKPKKISVGKLQESCCQELGTILTELPDILKRIADVQQETMRGVTQYLEGGKKGLWVSNKQQLAANLDTVSTFEQQLHTIETQLNDFLLFLHKAGAVTAKK